MRDHEDYAAVSESRRHGECRHRRWAYFLGGNVVSAAGQDVQPVKDYMTTEAIAAKVKHRSTPRKTGRRRRRYPPLRPRRRRHSQTSIEGRHFVGPHFVAKFGIAAGRTLAGFSCTLIPPGSGLRPPGRGRKTFPPSCTFPFSPRVFQDSIGEERS